MRKPKLFKINRGRVIAPLVAIIAVAAACGNKEGASAGDGDTSTSSSGDGDHSSTTSSSGDSDSTSGDGDATTSSTGDGDATGQSSGSTGEGGATGTDTGGDEPFVSADLNGTLVRSAALQGGGDIESFAACNTEATVLIRGEVSLIAGQLDLEEMTWSTTRLNAENGLQPVTAVVGINGTTCAGGAIWYDNLPVYYGDDEYYLTTSAYDPQTGWSTPDGSDVDHGEWASTRAEVDENGLGEFFFQDDGRDAVRREFTLDAGTVDDESFIELSSTSFDRYQMLDSGAALFVSNVSDPETPYAFVQVQRVRDTAGDWSDEQEVPAEVASVQFVIDAKDRFYAVTQEALFEVSAQGVWGDAIPIPDTLDGAQFAAAGAHLFALWRIDTPTHVLMSAFFTKDEGWSEPEQVSADQHPKVLYTETLAVNQSGHALVVYGAWDNHLMLNHYVPGEGWTGVASLTSNLGYNQQVLSIPNDDFLILYEIPNLQTFSSNQYLSRFSPAP